MRQRNKSAATLCKYAVSVLFHSPLGVLFTFPSRYLFAIGRRTYVALPVSPGRFARAIRVSSYSRTVTQEAICFRIRCHYPLGLRFPADSPNASLRNSCRVNTISLPYNPEHVLAYMLGLGSSLFARRYLGNHKSRFPFARLYARTESNSHLFSFPLGTEMFHFPRYASLNVT